MEPLQPRRVLVAGDVHGNRRWIGTLCKLARRHGCEVILQVGDFGYWPHTDDGRRFLAHVDWHAERNGIECVYWIDGNHENHDALSAVVVGINGSVEISERCRYLPRGVRWTWSGVRFGALGGAFSVDWRERVVGESWWEGECPTRADLVRLGAGPLDVLVAHDAPAGIPLSGLRLPPADEIRANEVRELVAEAVRATEPALVLHGHWHIRSSHKLTWPVARGEGLVWKSTMVEGLAADVQGGQAAWGILELAPLRFLDARPCV